MFQTLLKSGKKWYALTWEIFLQIQSFLASKHLSLIAYNILTSKRQHENFYVCQIEVSKNRIWNFQFYRFLGRKAQFFHYCGIFIGFGIMIIFLVIQSLLSKALLTVSEWYL